jgi:small conductance mechanosensitive channel
MSVRTMVGTPWTASVVMVCLLLLVASASARAQSEDETAGAPDEATEAAEQAAGSGGASDEAPPEEKLIAVEELRLRILPLRLEELEEEVENWIGQLEAKVRELTAAEIEAKSLEGDAKQAKLAEAAKDREQRSALVERVDLVLDAFENKGGDVEKYRKYVEAVSGTTIDVEDTTAAWIAIKSWATSKEGGIKIGLNIIKALAILVVFWIVGKIVGGIVFRAVKRVKKTSALLQEFLGNISKNTIYLIGVVVAISMIGVNIGPLVAAIGAAGLVIGFALQGTLSNFASGIMILLYRPFDVGDVVNVSGVSGKVESMTLVSTNILTFDNQQVIVPNNSIWGDVITNVTGRPIRRIDMIFGISYADDVDRAHDILSEIVRSHGLVLADPEPTIKVHELGDSSVNFIVRPWSKTGDYWTIYWDLMRDVKKRFDAEGITIPFPQRDVHVHQVAQATA